jgi:Heterogeneous nuclear ribonucleoprotein Q acidic domain
MRALLEALPQLLSLTAHTKCVPLRYTQQALVAQGLIDAAEIDERLGDALSRLKEEDAISALDEYAVCDLNRVRSKGAYLMGLVKRYRTGQVTVTFLTVTSVTATSITASRNCLSSLCCVAVALLWQHSRMYNVRLFECV